MRLSCLWWSVLLWYNGTDLVNAEDQIQHRKLIRASLGNAISDRYIVILNGKVADVISKAKSLLQDSGATIDFEYDTVFKGFAVNGLVAKFLTIILDDNMVLSVEEDAVVTEDASFQYTQTSPPNWGLDRIDQINRSFNNIYGYTYTGKGVYIFTIDSGINLSHNEFTGRAYCGYSVISGENCDDYRGHGSHVAGIAGGTTVRLWASYSMIFINSTKNAKYLIFIVRGGKRGIYYLY
jgi:subtilisin family serine protease